MNNLLKPYRPCLQGVEDTLYYHIYDKKTGVEAYVFSEFNTFFKNIEHVIVGKCFYVHFPDHELYEGSKTTCIDGKLFLNLGYKKEADEFLVNSDVEIQKFALENKIASKQALDNLYSCNYSCFDEALVVGVSEPREVLKLLYKKNSKVKRVIDDIISDFDVTINDLGITGSLALGAESASDIDVVFYGRITKLLEIKKRINGFRKERGEVKEYGLNWPCRYYDKHKNLICCFFVCTDYDYEPLKNAEIVGDAYQFDVTVKDDAFSILKTPVLDIYSEEFSSLIIFNSGFKGVFKKGDRIRGAGKIIRYQRDGKAQRAILCLNPYDEIFDYQTYFDR